VIHDDRIDFLRRNHGPDPLEHFFRKRTVHRIDQRDLLIDDEGKIDVLISINSGVKAVLGAPTPLCFPVNDSLWKGTAVSFVPKPFTGQEAKIKRIWEAKDSPGAWLTHSVPKREAPEPTPDDVTQIDRS